MNRADVTLKLFLYTFYLGLAVGLAGIVAVGLAEGDTSLYVLITLISWAGLYIVTRISKSQEEVLRIGAKLRVDHDEV